MTFFSGKGTNLLLGLVLLSTLFLHAAAFNGRMLHVGTSAPQRAMVPAETTKEEIKTKKGTQTEMVKETKKKDPTVAVAKPAPSISPPSSKLQLRSSAGIGTSFRSGSGSKRSEYQPVAGRKVSYDPFPSNHALSEVGLVMVAGTILIVLMGFAYAVYHEKEHLFELTVQNPVNGCGAFFGIILVFVMLGLIVAKETGIH